MTENRHSQTTPTPQAGLQTWLRLYRCHIYLPSFGPRGPDTQSYVCDDCTALALDHIRRMCWAPWCHQNQCANAWSKWIMEQKTDVNVWLAPAIGLQASRKRLEVSKFH